MFGNAKLPLILVLTAVALSGCVISIGDDEIFEHEESWQEAQRRNDRYIDNLALGASRSAVQAELGEPDYRDVFQRDNAEFNVLYYRTQHRRSDGKTTRDETTPLVFVDGRLVGWGLSAIDRAMP